MITHNGIILSERRMLYEHECHWNWRRFFKWHVYSRVDMNPFLLAATKHITDNIGLSPEEATNAIMITANNNITVAAGNGLSLGQGFVVIGVPFK